MYYAIVTKFHGPTKYRQSRISATAFDWEYSLRLNPDSNSLSKHRAAAMALATERGWISTGENRNLAGGMHATLCGVLADGSYVWVLVAGANS
jgi:hypothetical protein